jgi:hypothetical protein
MKTCVSVSYYLAELILEWEIFHIKEVEKIKTQPTFRYLLSEKRTVYEKMWKNVETVRPQMRILKWLRKCYLRAGWGRHDYKLSLR